MVWHGEAQRRYADDCPEEGEMPPPGFFQEYPGYTWEEFARMFPALAAQIQAEKIRSTPPQFGQPLLKRSSR